MRYHLWSVSVPLLAKVTNPLADDVWGCGIIEPDEILACTDMTLGKQPSWRVLPADRNRAYHIARVAYLMGVEPDPDERDEMRVYTPVDYHEALSAIAENDFSPWAIRGRQQVRVLDGNHRFVAAVLAGRESVNIEPEGDIAFLRKTLSPVVLI